MNLTPTQLDLISKELIQGGIKYQDLYEELLDHYILAIEDRQAQGQTFESAFGEVHSDFVNYKRPAYGLAHYGAWDTDFGKKHEVGLGKLQVEYATTLSKEISKRHWQIMKSYFRWPTLVTTLLVGLLTFQFAYLVSRQYLFVIMAASALAPFFIILPHSVGHLWQYLMKKRKFANSLKSSTISQRTSLAIAICNCTIFLPKVFEVDFSILKDGHIAILASLICFYLTYSLSFIQLYKERFRVKTT